MVQKRSKKETRAMQVLLGLVELFLETGKPIGSHTLTEHGFDHLSSATIRNYFAELEKEGFLKQPHSSGGRIPTHAALRLYAAQACKNAAVPPDIEEKLGALPKGPLRDVARYLQEGAELLTEHTGLAVFLSSVRFDHDFILETKLVAVDAERILCVLITDFGQVLTELLALPFPKLSTFALKRIETYIQWRLKGAAPPEHLSSEEQEVAQKLYNEIMVRYLVRYSNFSDEEIFRTGFSQLLAYPEFQDPVALATGLSLFENTHQMRTLLNDCVRTGGLRCWIGSDLAPYSTTGEGCSVVAIPYFIGKTPAGAIGLLGPCRMPYKRLLGTLTFFAQCITQTLTKSLVKFKLSYRQPRSGVPYLQYEEKRIVDPTSQKLLDVQNLHNPSP